MDVRFSITIRQRASLRDLIEAIPEDDWTPIPYWMDGAADVAETTYRACLKSLLHLICTMRDGLDSGVRRNDVIEIWRQVRHLVERRSTEH